MAITSPEAGRKIAWFLFAQVVWTAVAALAVDATQYTFNGIDDGRELAESVAAGDVDKDSEKFKKLAAEVWDFDPKEWRFNDVMSGRQWAEAAVGGAFLRLFAFGLRKARLN